MKLPSQNEAGYYASAVNPSSNFEKTRYMLVHGTADDNVHFQQSLYLLAHFQEAGISSNVYSEHFVADDNHSMSLTSGAFMSVMNVILTWFQWE